MRKVGLLCAWTVLMYCAAVPAYPQEDEIYITCTASASSQAALTRCAGEMAKRADDTLNAVYSRLLDLIAASPAAVEKARSQERAWLTYRDAYIAAMYPAENKQLEYGTMFPMEVNLLRTKLTHMQIAQLEALVERHGKKKTR